MHTTFEQKTRGVEMSEDMRQTIVHSLRVAADKYVENAMIASSDFPNLRHQFTQQAARTRAIADVIEQAEFIRLAPAHEGEE